MEWFTELVARATQALREASFGALAALFIVSGLTEVGVPFPFLLDSVLFYAGYEFGMLSPRVGLILAALLLGREMGGGAIYWLSYFLGEQAIVRLEKRFPSLRGKLQRVVARLGHNAPVAVAIARLTPGLLSAASVSSGACGVRYRHFALGIVLASAVADGALLASGIVTNQSLRYLGFKPPTWLLIVIFAVVACLVWAIPRIWVSRRNKHDSGGPPTGSMNEDSEDKC